MNYFFSVMSIGFKRKVTWELVEPEKICCGFLKEKGELPENCRFPERRWMPLGSSLSHRYYRTLKQSKFVIARKKFSLSLYVQFCISIQRQTCSFSEWFNLKTSVTLLFHATSGNGNFEKYVNCISGLINYFKIRFSDFQEVKRNALFMTAFIITIAGLEYYSAKHRLKFGPS